MFLWFSIECSIWNISENTMLTVGLKVCHEQLRNWPSLGLPQKRWAVRLLRLKLQNHQKLRSSFYNVIFLFFKERLGIWVFIFWSLWYLESWVPQLWMRVGTHWLGRMICLFETNEESSELCAVRINKQRVCKDLRVNKDLLNPPHPSLFLLCCSYFSPCLSLSLPETAN